MSKKQRIPLVIALLVIVAVVLRLTVFGGTSSDGIILASGTVEAAEADLGFQTPGRIESIAVRGGCASICGRSSRRTK